MTAWRGTLGAIPDAHGTTFRVWAPRPGEVRLVLRHSGAERDLVMAREPGGYRVARVEGVGAGTRYGFRLDGEGPYPDPCSRSQPGGVHALSEVADTAASFAWADDAWSPPEFADLVIYELHVGTFTQGGTFESAIERFAYLRDLGVTAIELMPVAAFPGRWNWGYDGVALFAPASPYGGPHGLRRFVDAAHAHGLAVILDVVYNHFGPDGNYTGLYATDYLTDRHHTPWGAAINFDGPGAAEVRRFYRENLLHWAHEYHIDGFRLDATHAIIDGSATHILAELGAAVSEHPRSGHVPWLIAESHENDVRYLAPRDEGGFGFDAVWADDFHHAVRTAIHDEHEGYFRGFDGTVETLARIAGQGWYYEGQLDPGYGAERGTPARDIPGWPALVFCIQNHDQVGNRAFGDRLGTTASLDDYRTATLLLLLLPETPLLFQGQEFAASSPFQFFTDHSGELGGLVTEGRRREFAGFSAFADPAIRERIPDPQDEATFRRSVLRWDEAEGGLGGLLVEFHRALLGLRRDDPVLMAARRTKLPIATRAGGRVLALELADAGARRWIVLNLGTAATLDLGLPPGARVVLHSSEARFGGNARAPRVKDRALDLPAHCAAFLAG